MQRQVGITFLLVTHDQEEALSMSDQLAIMNAGRIEQVGIPKEVYLRPHSRFVADFLGAVNWIEGVGVRPQATRIARSAEPEARSLTGVVEHSTFLGDRVLVPVRLANGEQAFAQVSRNTPAFEPGDQVNLCWNAADEMRFA